MSEELARPLAPALTDLAGRLATRIDIKPLAAASSLALFVGGLIVLLFFQRIRFMPDADLASSTAILFAAALVGIGTLAFYAGVSLLPGVATAQLLRERGLPPDRLIELGIPGAAVLVTLIFLALLGFQVSSALPDIGVVCVVAAFGIGFVAALRARQLRRRRDATTPGAVGTWFADLAILVGVAGLWFLGVFFALVLAVELLNEADHGTTLSVLYAVIWLGVVLWVNLTAARMSALAGSVFLFISAIPTAVILVALAGGPGTFAGYVLRQLGMAEVAHVDLVVEPAVCRSLALTSATGLRCAQGADAAVGVLRDVRVRSRIGTQMVVQPMAALTKDGAGAAKRALAGPHLVVRKSDVVLWVRR